MRGVLEARPVSWTAYPAETARYVVLRASAGEPLPESLVTALRQARVASGWIRAAGVLRDVELRALDPQARSLGPPRRIAGAVQLLSLEGSIGASDGQPSVALRAVLARETERGLETLAGEIASATTVAFEALVTALDGLPLARALDEGAGVWMLAMPPADAASAPQVGWTGALEASTRAEPEPHRPRHAAVLAPATGEAVMPARPARPAVDFDVVYPESGDLVEHFAFGTADVVKSDGDRLHLKMVKDSRIREIALEMLRVTRLPDAEDGRRHFQLQRRM